MTIDKEKEEVAKGNETKNLKVGDFVTTYHKGYHKITRFERRFVEDGDLVDQHLWLDSDPWKKLKVGDEITALVHYKKWDLKKGKLSGGKKEECCDISYVFPAELGIEKEIASLEATILDLKALSAIIKKQQ